MKKETKNLRGDRPGLKRETRLLFFGLLGMTVLLTALYFALQSVFPYMHYLYLAVGVIVGFWYVIYNRGFVTKNATPEMFSEQIPLQEREEMIEDGKRRMRRSRPALLIIFPIIVTLACDLIYLIVLPTIKELLS